MGTLIHHLPGWHCGFLALFSLQLRLRRLVTEDGLSITDAVKDKSSMTVLRKWSLWKMPTTMCWVPLWVDTGTIVLSTDLDPLRLETVYLDTAQFPVMAGMLPFTQEIWMLHSEGMGIWMLHSEEGMEIWMLHSEEGMGIWMLLSEPGIVEWIRPLSGIESLMICSEEMPGIPSGMVIWTLLSEGTLVKAHGMTWIPHHSEGILVTSGRVVCMLSEGTPKVLEATWMPLSEDNLAMRSGMATWMPPSEGTLMMHLGIGIWI